MRIATYLTAGAVAFAAGCSPLPDDGAAGADGATVTTPERRAPFLSVLLTDAPGDFDEVWVNVVSVEIESAEQGWVTLTETPQAFDLLTLQNDVTAALGGATLAPGSYGQLRLRVDEAHVVTDGVTEALRIASGAQTGVKIVLDTVLEENMTYAMVLDFDAGESIHQTGQGWLMTPVIELDSLTGTPVPPAGEPDPVDAGTEPDGDAPVD